MYEQEKQRAIHLMILLYSTFFMAALISGSIFLGWEARSIVLLILGLAACWLAHITERVPESIRLWMYFILTMLAFFFYGTHEIAIYDLAPVIIVFILVYTATEESSFVRLCAATYFLTICYDFVFQLGNPLKLPMDMMARIFFHFVIVFIAERLAEAMLQRNRKEREKMGERISQLEETNRRAEDFLANVSHELRTPINAVTGISAMMLRSEEDPGRRKDLLSIQMAGNRLFGQIEDILDYTEIDTGRIAVSEESYMIPSLVSDFIAENQRMGREKGLELIFDIDAGIPSVLLGDGRKIKKIMKHLVDNAVKFTKRGGVYVRIYALHRSYGINLCIRVSDTGSGIAEEELEKITERFFQSNGGRNRRAGGLGLGLPIVYGMVTAMDGFIQLESTEGSGTTVSVSIPQNVADATPNMEVPNRAELCIGLYLRPEKYEVPRVRDFYNTMITHMVKELELTVHRVFELEELKRLVSTYRLTHLVIGREEYEEDASFFEGVDTGVEVIVVADEGFAPGRSSRVKYVRKPFYCLPVVNILNYESSSDSESESMICPGVRILVVDDEPMNLMVAEGIFKDYQMEVRTAASGKEAIDICKMEEFDLVFLDHMMPEMDGVETLKLLRKLQNDTGRTNVIIAFTANAVSGAREMFLQEGFDEFISKPIEEQELKRVLRKVLPKASIAYVREDEEGETAVGAQGEVPGRADAGEAAAERTDAGEAVAERTDTGEQAGENSMEAKLARLEEKGFHTENGLIYCRSDREYYEKLLAVFAKSAEAKLADIEDSFREGDLKNYEIKVHALKSSSKMVGADALSEMAKRAEEAAKNRDGAYIRENHEGLMDRYRGTVQDILEVLMLGADEPSPTGETPATGREISEDELLAHLSGLKESLDMFDANTAEEQLEEMRGLVYQGTSVSGLLRDIGQDVENFEMVAASDKVEEIIHRMERR